MSPYLLGATTSLSPLIAIGAGFVSYRWLSKELHFLLIYCLLNLCISVVSVFVFALRGINNHWLMHFFTPLQFGVFVYVLSHWQPQAVVRKIFIGTIIAFIIFWAWGFLVLEDVRSFSTVTRPVAAVLLVLASSVTLVQTVRGSPLSIARTPAFWISSGILIYFAGMSVLLSMSNMLLTVSIETLRLIWPPIQGSLHLTLNIFFAIGFLCLRPKSA